MVKLEGAGYQLRRLGLTGSSPALLKVACMNARPPFSGPLFQRISAFGLVWALLLAGGGAVSPAVHGWLHGPEPGSRGCGASGAGSQCPTDDGSGGPEPEEGHFCGVTLLQTGAWAPAMAEPAPASGAPAPPPPICAQGAPRSSSPPHKYGRAPPVGSVAHSFHLRALIRDARSFFTQHDPVQKCIHIQNPSAVSRSRHSFYLP